jgi:hypothetical protein
MTTDVISPPAERGPEAGTVVLTVNGQPRELRIEPRVSLLDASREHLGLPGSKKSCDQGTCGPCTVWVDGRRVLACLTLAVTGQAQQNREYVRRMLKKQQPGFAAVLEWVAGELAHERRAGGGINSAEST